eukprot:575765-Pyramimonas_sp.AAC.3
MQSMDVRLKSQWAWGRASSAVFLLLVCCVHSSIVAYTDPVELDTHATVDPWALEQRQAHRKLARVADSRVQLEVHQEHEHEHAHGEGVMPHVKLHIDFSNIPFWEKHFSAADL